MTQLLTPSPIGGAHSLRRFTVDEYHRMIQLGILAETDRVELLEGHVFMKGRYTSAHDSTIQRLHNHLFEVLAGSWGLRIKSAITLSDSEPEPDLALVRGSVRTYLSRHPGPADTGLVIEVADSSLDRDREKARIYANAGIAVYWIVNLVDHWIEEYSLPTVSPAPQYVRHQDHRPGANIDLVLGGAVVASPAVGDLLP
jgi:Uma2 family endonuclease